MLLTHTTVQVDPTAGFSVTRTGTSYSVQITAAGTGYLATESFTVAGDVLGGAAPANNATITVQTIGASEKFQLQLLAVQRLIQKQLQI